MKIFPAIDLYDKKAVRLFKGDYNQMTVYSNEPVSVRKILKNRVRNIFTLLTLKAQSWEQRQI